MTAITYLTSHPSHTIKTKTNQSHHQLLTVLCIIGGAAPIPRPESGLAPGTTPPEWKPAETSVSEDTGNRAIGGRGVASIAGPASGEATGAGSEGLETTGWARLVSPGGGARRRPPPRPAFLVVSPGGGARVNPPLPPKPLVFFGRVVDGCLREVRNRSTGHRHLVIAWPSPCPVQGCKLSPTPSTPTRRMARGEILRIWICG